MAYKGVCGICDQITMIKTDTIKHNIARGI